MGEPSKGASKFPRFLPSGFRSKKEKGKASPIPNAGVGESAANRSFAAHPASNVPLPSSALDSVPDVEPETSKPSGPARNTEPAASGQGKDTTEGDQEEALPTSVALAKERLNEAGKKLRTKIPPNVLESAAFEIKGTADINVLADNVGSALVKMMEERSVSKSRQSRARVFVAEWAKKTVPFVEKGFTIANVQACDHDEADSDRTFSQLPITSLPLEWCLSLRLPGKLSVLISRKQRRCQPLLIRSTKHLKTFCWRFKTSVLWRTFQRST